MDAISGSNGFISCLGRWTIGVTPDTVLAKEAGLELGIKESIVVNDRMETSVPDIFAAGDAVQVKHYVTGNDALISLALVSLIPVVAAVISNTLITELP